MISPQSAQNSGKTDWGWKALGDELEQHLYEHDVRQVYRSDSPKLYSEPGETNEAFAGRVAQQMREARDKKVDALREKYEQKRRRLEDHIHSAEARVDKERSQYESARVQSTISIGGTLLGALFGRKVTRSATSSARSVSRAAAQKGDIARAQQKVERLEGDIDELDDALREQIEDIRQSPLQPAIETVLISPLKGDIDVELSLAWVDPTRLALL